MEFWSKVRRRVLTGELSKREACKVLSSTLGHAYEDIVPLGAAGLSQVKAAREAGIGTVYSDHSRDAGSGSKFLKKVHIRMALELL
jgi:hypothetical protein